MRRTLLLCIAGLLLVPAGLAGDHVETVNGVEVTPGLTTPDSVFYGVELAFDRAAMAVGLRSSSDIAKKRAAEAHQMAKENNTAAVNRAVKEMNAVIEQTPAEEADALATAATVLEEVKAEAPEAAQPGLAEAQQNIQKARQKTGSKQPADPPEDKGNVSDKNITIDPNVDRHIVGVTPDGDVAAVKRRANTVRRVIDFGDIGKAVSGTFSVEALEELQHRDDVRYIEPDREASIPEQPDPAEYTCPDQDYINCMPGPAERHTACYGDYHEWVQEHCDVQFAW